MRRWALPALLLVLTVLAAGAGTWLAPGGLGPRQLDGLRALVERIESASRSRSIEAGRVHGGTSVNYEELAWLTREIEGATGILEARLASLEPPERDLVRTVRRFLSAVRAQTELIERFKTELAAITESRRYLPDAEIELDRLARDLAPLEAARTQQLRERTNVFLLGIRRYEATLSRPLHARLMGDLDDLEPMAARAGGVAGAQVRNILAHGRVVLDRAEPLHRAFSQLADGRVEDGAGDALAAIDRRARDFGILVRYRTTALVALAAAVVLAWCAYGALLVARRRRTPGESFEGEVLPRAPVVAGPAPPASFDAEPPERLAADEFSKLPERLTADEFRAYLASVSKRAELRLVGAPGPVPAALAAPGVALACAVPEARLILAAARRGTVLTAHAPAGSDRVNGRAFAESLARWQAAGAEVSLHSSRGVGTTVRIAVPRPETDQHQVEEYDDG